MSEKTKKKAAVKKAASGRRKQLPRASAARGPEASEARLDVEDPAIAAVVARVRAANGVVSGAYRDPLSGTPLVLAILPLGAGLWAIVFSADRRGWQDRLAGTEVLYVGTPSASAPWADSAQAGEGLA